MSALRRTTAAAMACACFHVSPAAWSHESARELADQHERVPHGAWEYTFAVGLARAEGAFGALATQDLGARSRPGATFDFGLGWRASRSLTLAGTLEYAELGGERQNAVHSTAAGVALTWHVRPARRVDPWLLVGTGYRLLWDQSRASSPAQDLFAHGFRAGRAAVGVDLRLAPQVAFAPMVGVDLNVLLWQEVTGGRHEAIAGPRPSAFVFAGAQVRFDVLGRYDDE